MNQGTTYNNTFKDHKVRYCGCPELATNHSSKHSSASKSSSVRHANSTHRKVERVTTEIVATERRGADYSVDKVVKLNKTGASRRTGSSHSSLSLR